MIMSPLISLLCKFWNLTNCSIHFVNLIPAACIKYAALLQIHQIYLPIIRTLSVECHPSVNVTQCCVTKIILNWKITLQNSPPVWGYIKEVLDCTTWFISILRMSIMKCVTLAVFMVSAQGAPQFPALDQFPQLQQFLNGLNSNGVALPPLPAWLQGIRTTIKFEPLS